MKKKVQSALNNTEQLPSVKSYSKPHFVTPIDVKNKNFKKSEKWDALHQIMIKLSKCKTYEDIIISIPSALEGIFEFDKLSIIIISPKLHSISNTIKLTENGLSLIEEFYLDRWTKIVLSNQYSYSKLQFANMAQLSAGRKK